MEAVDFYGQLIRLEVSDRRVVAGGSAEYGVVVRVGEKYRVVRRPGARTWEVIGQVVRGRK